MPNCTKYRPTIILIAINVAIYIAGAIAGGNALYTGEPTILQWGQVNASVLYNGAYYQLFTSMFIHASIFHLVGNMLSYSSLACEAKKFSPFPNTSPFTLSAD